MALIPLKTGYRPHAQDLLFKYGFEKSQGGSARGWSALQLPGRCWRLAYYRLIKGLRSKRPSDAIDVGVLYHACMEQHFTTGGVDTLKPLEALASECPDIVYTVRRMLEARFAKFGAEDARTWDVRAIEQEISSRLTGVPRCGAYKGRKIEAPVSSKFDAVIGKREPGAPPAAPGPVPGGVWVVDWKSTSRISREKVSGFGFDPQLLLMAHNWRANNLDAVYGPLRGFVLEIITTTKDPTVDRLEIVIEDADVERFIAALTPWAVELESMLAMSEHEDINAWPMNFAGCRAVTLCGMWDICESRGGFTSEYEVTPGFTPARGLLRQKPKRGRKPKAVTQAPALTADEVAAGPIFCAHANEMPGICPCPETCWCWQPGNVCDKHRRTRVVNLHRESYDVYVGRPGNGESGEFGNPIKVGEVCPICQQTHLFPDDTLPCFTHYFHERLQTDADFARRVEGLRGRALGCFCGDPRLCHASVIADYLNNSNGAAADSSAEGRV